MDVMITWILRMCTDLKNTIEGKFTKLECRDWCVQSDNVQIWIRTVTKNSDFWQQCVYQSKITELNNGKKKSFIHNEIKKIPNEYRNKIWLLFKQIKIQSSVASKDSKLSLHNISVKYIWSIMQQYLHVSTAFNFLSLTLRRLMSYIYIYIWSTYSCCF